MRFTSKLNKDKNEFLTLNKNLLTKSSWQQVVFKYFIHVFLSSNF